MKLKTGMFTLIYRDSFCLFLMTFWVLYVAFLYDELRSMDVAMLIAENAL